MLKYVSTSRTRAPLVQDPRVVVSVIMKLTGGSASFAKEMNPDAFLRQALEFEVNPKP